MEKNNRILAYAVGLVCALYLLSAGMDYMDEMSRPEPYAWNFIDAVCEDIPADCTAVFLDDGPMVYVSDAGVQSIGAKYPDKVVQTLDSSNQHIACQLYGYNAVVFNCENGSRIEMPTHFFVI